MDMMGIDHSQQLNGRVNLTDTNAADVIAAQGVGKRIVVTGIHLSNAAAAVASKIEIRDGTTVKLRIHLPLANAGTCFNAGGKPLFIATANAAVTARAVTNASDTEVNITGYYIYE